MARDIVIWCDPCLAQETRTDATEVTVAFDTGKPRVVAVCGAHYDELVKPLQALLEQYGEQPDATGVKTPKGRGSLAEQVSASGRRHGKPPANGRPNQCLWCDLSYSQDGGGFARHLKVEHGFSGLVEAFGGVCPICGGGQFDIMYQHCKRAHPDLNITHVTAPFEWARDNGDPHGVYAAKLKQQPSLDPDQAHAEVRAAEDASRARTSTEQQTA